jgi:hypothetical protein
VFLRSDNVVVFLPHFLVVLFPAWRWSDAVIFSTKTRLEPSPTAICLALGLGQQIMGITHHCHETILANEEKELGKQQKQGVDHHEFTCVEDDEDKDNSNNDILRARILSSECHILTRNGLMVEDQDQIHKAVVECSANDTYNKVKQRGLLRLLLLFCFLIKHILT